MTINNITTNLKLSFFLFIRLHILYLRFPVMSTAGPAHRVQSAVVEYGYPQGHLGHLTAEEETAFLNFKTLCAEKGYYKPGASKDELPSHDDALLLYVPSL